VHIADPHAGIPSKTRVGPSASALPSPSDAAIPTSPPDRALQLSGHTAPLEGPKAQPLSAASLSRPAPKRDAKKLALFHEIAKRFQEKTTPPAAAQLEPPKANLPQEQDAPQAVAGVEDAAKQHLVKGQDAASGDVAGGQDGGSKKGKERMQRSA
jgi:hypothetical protein